MESLVIAEETVPRLEAENSHLQDTVARITEQLTETETTLEGLRIARITAETAAAAKAKEIEQSWSAVLAEKQNNWNARERGLEERVESQERLLKELKASYETSQRLAHGDEVADEFAPSTASAAELEIVNAELERTNLRLAEVEARNEQLRVELAQSTSQSGVSKEPTKLEDDPAFLHLRSENSSLLRKLDMFRLEKESERRKWDGEARNMRREIAALKEAQENIRQKLSKWSDYEDVKRELDILKSIEFAAGENEDVEQGDTQESENKTATSAGLDSSQKLEQLLLGRNKKLNDELTLLRVSHQDLTGRLEALQNELTSTNMELERSKNLTATLENDLSKMQDNAYPAAAPSVAGTYTSRYQPSSYGRRGRVSPTSSIISGFDSSYNSPNTLEALRNGESMAAGSGILPMITAQRDRFKKRNNDLEMELAKAQQSVAALRSEVASLQKDNLSLYERTRYVSTYSRGQPTSSSNSLTTNPNPSSIQVSDDDGPLGKYKSAYEARISPFAAFRGRESSRAFRRMTLPERMVFRATRLVLATRMSRNFFALYVILLHILLFSIFVPSSGAAMVSASARASGGGTLVDDAVVLPEVAGLGSN